MHERVCGFFCIRAVFSRRCNRVLAAGPDGVVAGVCVCVVDQCDSVGIRGVCAQVHVSGGRADLHTSNLLFLYCEL